MSEIANLVRFYNEHVRRHDKSEMRGIFRQVKLMTQKGVTLAQISQAMQAYAKDPWTRGLPEYRRHHIRTFMMPERIRQYAAPRVSSDPSFDRMAAMTEMLVDGSEIAPPPLIPITSPTAEAPDPEPEQL